MAYTDYLATVQKYYVAYYGRPADPVGQEFWAKQMDAAKGNPAAIINAFGNSAEATALFGSMTTEQKINKIYQQCFGRDAEATGLLYYANGVASGTFTLASLMMNVANGATGTDATAINNKLTSAALFTTDLSTNASALVNYTGTGVTTAKTWLAGITTTAATAAQVATTITSVISTGAGATTGTTFTLTTAADNITGTDANDTINGVVSTTYQLTDTINGGAGTDTLSLIAEIAAADVALPAAAIQNVEVIKARVLTSDGVVSHALTIDASLTPGVTEVSSDRSTEKLTVTSLATGAAIGMIGDSTVTNANIDFAYATATNPATINISNGTKAGTINNTGASPTTVVVNSTGAANTVTEIDCGTGTNVTSLTINAATNLTASLDNDYAATSTLTVSGAATAVTLTGGAAATLKTINAAGLTAGGLSLALSTTATGFTGGTGNDTVTTAAITGTAGAINAGAGTADVLIINADTDTDSATKAGYYTNFEVLQTGGTQDVSLFSGINALKLSAGNSKSITKLTATQAADVTVTATKTGTTLSLTDATGTTDVLTLKLKSGTSTTNVSATTLTVNGFETMNVQATTGTSGTDSAIDFTAADKLTAVNLAGSTADVSIIGSNTTLAMTVDGSTATGKLKASGNFVSGSTISGGAAVDTFTVGTGFATYNGNAGNDSFLSATVAALNTGASYNYMDGGAGTDTLTVSAATLTMIDDNFKGLTNIEKLTFTGTGAQSVTTGGWFDTNFKAAGVTITAATVDNDVTASYLLSSFSGAVTLALTTSGVGNTGADNITVKTGSGADTVTVTAASWVGHATTNGDIVIQTGAGADTINLQTGTLLANASAGSQIGITGGTGADVITVTHVNDAAITSGIRFITAAGDSTKAAYDSITGFKMSDIAGSGGLAGDGLDFGTAAIHATVAATAVSGFTGAELTYAINGTTGLVTFAGTSASSRTVAQVLDILDTVVTTGKTVFWASTTDTYVYNADTVGGDSVIKLVGVVGEALITTNDATTNNGIYIL